MDTEIESEEATLSAIIKLITTSHFGQADLLKAAELRMERSEVQTQVLHCQAEKLTHPPKGNSPTGLQHD